MSTLRLQLRHLRVTNPLDWAGIAKSAAHLVLPYRALRSLKARLLKATPSA
jgi:hypothetical protein